MTDNLGKRDASGRPGDQAVPRRRSEASTAGPGDSSPVDSSLPGVSDTAPFLSHDDVQQVIRTVDMPSCPAVLMRVMAEAQRDDPDIHKLSRIIADDIGLTALSLRFANSTLFRRGAPITSVRAAMAHLGTLTSSAFSRPPRCGKRCGGRHRRFSRPSGRGRLHWRPAPGSLRSGITECRWTRPSRTRCSTTQGCR